MITGSCLCKAVRYSVDGPIELALNCHCSMCRKAHGAPFVTYATVARENFRWTAGEAQIAVYESSPGTRRAFCSTCGGNLPNVFGNRVDMPAGSLDDGREVRPAMHIFVGSRAAWVELDDELPRHDTYPPEWLEGEVGPDGKPV